MESKTFEIARVPQSTMHKVALSGGGSVPDYLSGMFTTKKLCREAIDRYQDMLRREHQEQIAKRAARGKAKTA